MGLLSIDTSNLDELLDQKPLEPVPSGKYCCEVENDLKVEKSKSSDNEIIKVELRILDDSEYKGRKIFDNLVIGSSPDTKKNCEWKIAQFLAACGVSKEVICSFSADDLSSLKGSVCNVVVVMKTEQYEGEEKKKNVVKQYLVPQE